MDSAFDPKKDALSTAKHGISLAEGDKMEWDDALSWKDARRDYGEERMCAIGYIGSRLYYVVYVDRGTVRRFISLRKANLKEIRRYAEA